MAIKESSYSPEGKISNNRHKMPLQCRECHYWRVGENRRFGHCCYKPKTYELVDSSDPAHNYPNGRTTPAVYGCKHGND